MGYSCEIRVWYPEFFFERESFLFEGEEGNAPRHSTDLPDPGTTKWNPRSPPSRVTAMKSFVIAPLTSWPPIFEAPPSSYPKELSIGSSSQNFSSRRKIQQKSLDPRKS